MATINSDFASITNVIPEVSVDQILSQFVPPREFEAARFSNYVPDTRFASQLEAAEVCRQFATGKTLKNITFANSTVGSKPSGVYLDGGFGVGKTHLLASVWHDFKGKKLFGSFLSFTGLIGVLGFANTVAKLKEYDLICIDEFELDDPGDTMMLSRLLKELDDKGVRFAATSNTPPNALGQGRFAAADFAREIASMANRFAILSIDGDDYRHRPTDASSVALTNSEMLEWLDAKRSVGLSVAFDDFATLLSHLSTIHPSKYLYLLKGVEALGLTEVFKLQDQVSALRWVALVDRLYEGQIALAATGTAFTSMFSDEMIGGAYRKKYLRAISRLGALSGDSATAPRT